MVVVRSRSKIKWAKDSGISQYYLIYANRITHITIRKGDLFMSRFMQNNVTRFKDAGTNPKKWYLTDGWYTYYDRPFDTLADAKAYAVRQFVTGEIKGGEWEDYNPNSYPFRKE